MLAMSLLYTVNVLVRDLAPAYASRIAWIDEICLFVQPAPDANFRIAGRYRFAG